MKPRIVITTSSSYRPESLRRTDAIGGVNYAEAILQTGGLPMFLPNLPPEAADHYIQHADGVLFSGGVDIDPVHFGQNPHPDLGIVDEERDLFELTLYKAAKARGLPILGICRGIQLINVAEGGSLHQHVPALPGSIQHAQRNIGGTLFHELRLEPSSTLAKAFSSNNIRTNSYHHQGLDRLGNDLKAVAWSTDGLVEAVEGIGTFVLGVQWHPEMSFARYPDQIAPFKAFMQAVTAKQAQYRSAVVSV